LFSSAHTGQLLLVQGSKSASVPLLHAPAAAADDPLLLRHKASVLSPWLRWLW